MAILWTALIHEILPKLGSPLINAHSMANDHGTAPRSVRKPTALHPACLKPRYRIDSIKQTKKSNPPYRPGERLSKALEKVVHSLCLFFSLFVLVAVRIDHWRSALPLRKCFPSKPNHFLITVAQQTNVVEHLGQKPCNVGAPAETKHVNLITGTVEPHQEAIAAHHVLVKRGADG